MLLCSVVILVDSGSLAQLAFAFVICTIFLVAHVLIRPFKTDADNSYQSTSLVSTLLTIFAGIMIKADMAEHTKGTYDDFIITFVLMFCNVLVLVMFVLVLKRVNGGANKGNISAQKLLLKKVQAVAKKHVIHAARQQAQDYVDSIFKCLDKLEENFKTTRLSRPLKMLFCAMKEDMEPGSPSRGRYGGGELGIGRLMEDCSDLLRKTDLKDILLQLIYIAGGFAGKKVIFAFAELSADAVEELYNEAYKIEMQEPDSELLHVAAKIMAHNAAQRDVLEERMVYLLSNKLSVDQFLNAVREIPFLLCAGLKPDLTVTLTVTPKVAPTVTLTLIPALIPALTVAVHVL